MPNKDITNNQSNFIFEMTFGQAFSFNVTFSSRLALDGDHLLRRQEVPNNLPEPSFSSPPITEEDLQCLQMATRSKNPTIKSSIHIETKPPSNGPSNPTDDNSSSSSESDSSSSSDEDLHVPQVHTSILVLNKKSHIVHAALQISSDSMTRSRFQNQRQIFRS